MAASQPHRRLESYSYRCEIKGACFVFSGDIEMLEELEPLIGENLDLLILEVAHYEPTLIRDFVTRHGIRRTVLTHIHPGLEARIAELVAEWDGPRIQIAHDGLHITLEKEEA
jgi:ribonuclease BN (tRNA processing enzyme)